jgi:beta-glucosidase
LDPIIFGKYPAEMTKILGSAIPKFSSNDREKLNEGLDFIGINHYTGFYIQDCSFVVCKPGQGGSRTEGLAQQVQEKDGVPIGKSVCAPSQDTMFFRNYFFPHMKLF